MISRTHGLILSLLLGAAATTGAYAMIGTAKLGNAETKPELVSSRQIAKRSHKLDSWEASLRKALKSKPPALTPLNRYAAVTFVTGPGAAAMPVTVAPRRTVKPAQPAARQIAEVQPKHAEVAVAARPADKPKIAAPVAVAEPEHATRAPAPAQPLVGAAPAPAPATTQQDDEEHSAPAPSSAPPTGLTVEQQCRALLKAAEGKGEQAKQAAEKQCEALKQAAERR